MSAQSMAADSDGMSGPSCRCLLLELLPEAFISQLVQMLDRTSKLALLQASAGTAMAVVLHSPALACVFDMVMVQPLQAEAHSLQLLAHRLHGRGTRLHLKGSGMSLKDVSCWMTTLCISTSRAAVTAPTTSPLHAITHVTLQGVTLDYLVAPQLSLACPALRELRLQRPRFTELPSEGMQLPLCPQLQVLQLLEPATEPDVLLGQMQQQLRALPSLAALELRGETLDFSTDQFWQRVVSVVTTQLTSLRLASARDQYVPLLYKPWPQLQQLDISTVSVVDDVMAQLLSEAPALTHLTVGSFNLHGNFRDRLAHWRELTVRDLRSFDQLARLPLSGLDVFRVGFSVVVFRKATVEMTTAAMANIATCPRFQLLPFPDGVLKLVSSGSPGEQEAALAVALPFLQQVPVQHVHFTCSRVYPGLMEVLGRLPATTLTLCGCTAADEDSLAHLLQPLTNVQVLQLACDWPLPALKLLCLHALRPLLLRLHPQHSGKAASFSPSWLEELVQELQGAGVAHVTVELREFVSW